MEKYVNSDVIKIRDIAVKNIIITEGSHEAWGDIKLNAKGDCAFLDEKDYVAYMFGTLSAIFTGVYPFLDTPVLIIGCGFILVAMVASFLTLRLGATPEFFPTAFRFRGGGFAQTMVD